MSLTLRRFACLGLLMSSLIVGTAWAQQQPAPGTAAANGQQDPARLWADFNHYVLIARPELAEAAGRALLDQTDLPTLLQVVESSDYKDYGPTLVRAKRINALADVAAELEQAIQLARTQVSREPERIAADIAQLPEGGRPYRNAVARLRAAGQFAAPQLLATLEADDKTRLHPYVLSAMAEIGQPIVAPLAVALPQLQPRVQAQVAQLLAEVGYPLPSLAYLKQVMESGQTDPTARRAVERAHDILMNRSDLPTGLSAAELFLILGEARYSQATRGEVIAGSDPSQNAGVVWEYGPRTGLVAVPVPIEVYGDVLAMRAAQQSLALNPNMDAALSLHLMANLRRENNLPDGADDPSYGEDRQPAAFYAMVAGPVRVQDVLARALRDMDAALALDAIEALSKTAGTDALIARGAAQQPLLRALSYPDRRVRFRAAEALTNARPTEAFSGAYRVVPVIAEAVRPIDTRYALIIANTQDRLNELLAAVGDQGYEAFGGLSLQDVNDEVQARPAVDLIVIDLDAQRTGTLLRNTTTDYKLGSVPIVAVVSRDRQLALAENFRDERRLTTTVDTGDPQPLASAIEQALAASGSGAVSDEDNTEFALTALALLRDVALGRSIYNVADAQPALIAALDDERDEVVSGAGVVLSLINSADAQRAIAAAALDARNELQVSLLGSLAASAAQYGNQLPTQQTNALLELVEDSEGDTAIAAARAHGALTLPTSNAVKLIVE